ncbi:hepatocellular carcinoma-associated antigen 59-domain-containing protein [Aspergillus ambiguus]|uniref:telomere length and silencing 1 family protein n=1 Tax=Aspergillus ambiguus TaxID=176160 RepID=UPI003CCCDB13
MDSDISPNPETLFRPVKRRKFQRRRPEEPQIDSTSSTPSLPQEESQEDVQPVDIVRLRRLHRARKGGIEFSATSRPSGEASDKSAVSSATAEELESERVRAMCDRFTGHTGQTVDVDKHMMAYIESEMAKRYRHHVPMDTAEQPKPATTDEANSPQTAADLPRREPASMGKLHEIDLGQEARLRNIARTEEATKRLVRGEPDGSSADDGTPSSERVEKPWPSRKRRTSEDLKRDRLVEEVLRESKRKWCCFWSHGVGGVDVYDEPDEDTAMGADDQAADDRVAEQFRRDFLDAIQSRRRVARAKTAATTKTAKPEAPKGPKLGGSRSARAAMREMQEKSGRK